MRESGEMYLETLLVMGKRNGNIRSIDLAKEMGFSKPTISQQVKKFRSEGYIDVDGEGYLTLTEKGKEIAEKIYERHNVISEIFLALGVSEQTAREDACRIEHYISDETYNKMKEPYLQNGSKRGE